MQACPITNLTELCAFNNEKITNFDCGIDTVGICELNNLVELDCFTNHKIRYARK